MSESIAVNNLGITINLFPFGDVLKVVLEDVRNMRQTVDSEGDVSDEIFPSGSGTLNLC